MVRECAQALSCRCGAEKAVTHRERDVSSNDLVSGSQRLREQLPSSSHIYIYIYIYIHVVLLRGRPPRSSRPTPPRASARARRCAASDTCCFDMPARGWVASCLQRAAGETTCAISLSPGYRQLPLDGGAASRAMGGLLAADAVAAGDGFVDLIDRDVRWPLKGWAAPRARHVVFAKRRARVELEARTTAAWRISTRDETTTNEKPTDRTREQEAQTVDPHATRPMSLRPRERRLTRRDARYARGAEAMCAAREPCRWFDRRTAHRARRAPRPTRIGPPTDTRTLRRRGRRRRPTH